MDLRQLRYFATVAAERNFRRAAERLNMAQPPLSRRIQQLEEEIGAVLIDRTAKPMELTPAGRLLYEQALQVLERVDELRAMMDRFIEAKRPRFVMGFVASTMYARLPDLIRGFRKSAPQVDLGLVELVSIEQIGALQDGRIDVGFGRIRLEDASVRRTVLREERLVVALPLAHRLSREEGPIRLSELVKETLIVYPRQPRPSYADQVLSLFRDHGLEPRSVQEARELQTAVGLVAEEGIAIVPVSIERLRSDDVRYRPLADTGATSPIIMSYRNDDRSAELKILFRVLRKMYHDWGYPIPDGLPHDA